MTAVKSLSKVPSCFFCGREEEEKSPDFPTYFSSFFCPVPYWCYHLNQILSVRGFFHWLSKLNCIYLPSNISIKNQYLTAILHRIFCRVTVLVTKLPKITRLYGILKSNIFNSHAEIEWQQKTVNKNININYPWLAYYRTCTVSWINQIEVSCYDEPLIIGTATKCFSMKLFCSGVLIHHFIPLLSNFLPQPSNNNYPMSMYPLKKLERAVFLLFVWIYSSEWVAWILLIHSFCMYTLTFLVNSLSHTLLLLLELFKIPGHYVLFNMIYSNM